MTEESKKTGKKPNLVYAALLLHSAGKEVTEGSLNKIVKACDISVEEVQLKALAAALHDVNIDEAISSAVAMPVASVATAVQTQVVEEKADEEDKGKKAEEAAEGLSSLFG
ncbi:MAG: 50S ribosomal protein P1 [Candidatus Aenigmarchaeota archaeon]|nr:50S ribosomal protein P1 [Candidatus Aenigmarchaeota archaeon]